LVALRRQGKDLAAMNLHIGDHVRNNFSPAHGQAEPSADSTDSDDWKEVALTAWLAPSWHEAAIEYHKARAASPSPRAAGQCTRRKASQDEKEIWHAAGYLIHRLGGRDALDTFHEWCRRHVSPSDRKRADAIFEMVAQKELSK
jgi:hypothetical protein